MAEARYDAIADFYDDMVGDDVADPVAAALLDLSGAVDGLRVLDFACGQGRISRELARRGASVVGADLSERLLEKAEDAERRSPLGISFAHADVTAPGALAGSSFDGVVCHFGLSDIDDLDGALATARRVLRDGGWFVFSIVHPCFPGAGDAAPSSWPPGVGYRAEGWWLAENPGFRGRVGSNHRMLSTYLNALAEHRLALECAVEPPPGDDWLRKRPGGDLVPVFLVARCRASG